MGVSIQTVTLPHGADKTARISEGFMAHTLSVGSTWNKLRVCFRLGLVAPDDSSITGTPRLLLGLCSGTTNIPGSLSVTNSLLFRSTTATWAVGGGTLGVLGHCSFSSADWASYHSGTTQTSITTANGGWFTRIARTTHPSLPGSSVIILEIEKGGTWTGRVVAPFPSSIGPNITPTMAMNAMQAYDFSLVPALLDPANYLLVSTSLGANPVQESTRGYLDSVCMAWNRLTQNMEFCEVIIGRYF